MKYGNQLEEASVPEWSLRTYSLLHNPQFVENPNEMATRRLTSLLLFVDNIDYNALKHEIKVHTTRDQATAIVIPGHQDPALQRFEDRLYDELCSQHDRVDLFVGSKADEISRRLSSIGNLIDRLIAKCDRDEGPHVSLKRQRKFSKYERDLLRCEEEILALSRFIKAQAEAFRKITKKYKVRRLLPCGPYIMLTAPEEMDGIPDSRYSFPRERAVGPKEFHPKGLHPFAKSV